jgi:hypothetical protein
VRTIRFVPGDRPNPDAGEIIPGADYAGVVTDDALTSVGETQMQKTIEKGVATVFAVAGGWLVSAGIVTPEGWDAATTPAVMPMAGVVTVMVYGFMNWATSKIMAAFGKD